MPKRTAPAGPGVSLSYVGGEVFNVPARDLSEADIARLADDPWVQRRLAKDPESLTEALLASGVYVAAAKAADEQPSKE